MILDSEAKRQRALRIIGTITIEQPLELTLKPWVARRTNEQNARLWLLHQKAAEHIGCSAAELHEDMLCSHYGYTEIPMPSGDIKRVPIERSSTKDKIKFGRFMEFCENTSIEKLGVFLGG